MAANHAAGKKSLKELPADSGLTKDMIPKYCYYRPASDKRGDKFVIDRHPKMEARQWATTESKAVSTKDKYQALLAKLRELGE